MSKSNEVTFNLADLQALIAEGVAKAMAGKASPSVPANVLVDGKTERQLKNEIAAVRAFKKAGFGTVKAREDVKTFRRWMADGFRPIEGTKGIKVKGFNLFHKSQVRQITAEEKAALQEQNEAAIARHEQASNVTPIQ